MESAAIHSSEVHEVVFRIPPSPFSQKEFFLPLRLSCKESSTFLTKPLFNSLYDPFDSPSRGQKPQEREDVAGSAIAPPEFWSASGACARKGLAGSVYAIKLRLLDATELRLFDAIGLRLFVGWRINLRVVLC